jgi:hypothetical protein
MPLTAEQAVAQVDSLYAELLARTPDVERFDAYYRGDHPLQFASDEFRKAFGGLFGTFADNWCGVVVDAKAERLEVAGFRSDDGREKDRASWDLWRSQDLDTQANAAFLEGLISGRVFGLAWAGPDGVSMTFEHPAQAIVGYAPGTRQRVAGLKAWADDDTEYATLYTADEVWKWRRPKLSRSPLAVVSYGKGGWEPREVADEPWPLPHDLGAVPLVEIPNRLRLMAPPQSELAAVIPVQDTVNLLWSHLITASDFAAFPQRVVLGAEQPMEAIRDADGNVVGERPIPVDRFRVSRIAWLEDADAKIGEWAAADLSNYTKVIELAVTHIAALTKTPPDYLLGQMVNLSGEALTAAERGLVSAVVERQNAFAGGLREFVRLGHLANGDPAAASGLAQGRVVWRDPQYRTEGEHVDALLKMRALGVPDEALWERLPGVDQTEIDRWSGMRDSAASRLLGGDIAALLGGVKPEPDAGE